MWRLNLGGLVSALSIKARGSKASDLCSVFRVYAQFQVSGRVILLMPPDPACRRLGRLKVRVIRLLRRGSIVLLRD